MSRFKELQAMFDKPKVVQPEIKAVTVKPKPIIQNTPETNFSLKRTQSEAISTEASSNQNQKRIENNHQTSQNISTKTELSQNEKKDPQNQTKVIKVSDAKKMYQNHVIGSKAGPGIYISDKPKTIRTKEETEVLEKEKIQYSAHVETVAPVRVNSMKNQLQNLYARPKQQIHKPQEHPSQIPQSESKIQGNAANKHSEQTYNSQEVHREDTHHAEEKRSQEHQQQMGLSTRASQPKKKRNLGDFDDDD